MLQRLVYRSRHSYATKSNQHSIVKTPVGKFTIRSLRSVQVDPNVPLPQAYSGSEQQIVKKVLKLQEAKEKVAPRN